jgi:hypothetical protein
VTFYFDASVPRAVPEGLSRVRDDIRWAGQDGCPGLGWSDEKWLTFAAERGWTVILRDKRARWRPGEREALRGAGLDGVFLLTGAGNFTKWQTLHLLVTRWDGMIDNLAEVKRPFICSVTKARVSVLN